ncbi:MAG: phosphate ABC transporter permease PstA [Bacillota bacterium]
MNNRAVVAHKVAIGVLWASAALTLGILIFIIAYILVHGLPVLSWSFVTGSPTEMGRSGGILPTIIGTFALTVLALGIATPLGVGTAIYLTEYTRPGPLTRVVRFGAESLAGVPSIIFGLFGFMFFVIYLGLGWSVLSGALTLAAMILPTIIRTSEEAIRAVPDSYREISFALGGTRWQTVTRAVLPSALPGILTGVMLGMGRCIGETAAVIFTAGATLRLPTSIFDPVRTMAVHFYILAREGISMPNAYGTAAILVISILAVNFVAYWLMQRFIARHS